MIDERILSFLNTQRLGVLSNVSTEGYPQVSVIHFSHVLDPLHFYISTENTTRKVKNIEVSEKASLVIGFSESEWITVQMDGKLEIVKDDLGEAWKIHYAKNPNSAKYKDLPETVFLKFTPTYLKFTDYNTDPLTLLEINL